ncbi:hypothetical protein [Clostridium perfringens]|uniref:hypothetical protein n=1 Tax=Clostridium perfringens TaxID=1502 RepID=UPI003F423633
MEGVNFYIYSENGVISGLSLDEAIEKFKTSELKTYKPLGVQRDMDSIDLLCKTKERIWLSDDYKNTIFNNNEIKKVREIIKNSFLDFKEIEIKDENIKEFLNKDKTIINEISKNELEKIIEENNSYIYFKVNRKKEITCEDFTNKNYVAVIKEKGSYKDIYIKKSYELEDLIYVDDDKNLYRIK